MLGDRKFAAYLLGCPVVQQQVEERNQLHVLGKRLFLLHEKITRSWTALEYAILRKEKVVATLMVIAAEAVKAEKRTPEFWQAERRWRALTTS